MPPIELHQVRPPSNKMIPALNRIRGQHGIKGEDADARTGPREKLMMTEKQKRNWPRFLWEKNGEGYWLMLKEAENDFLVVVALLSGIDWQVRNTRQASRILHTNPSLKVVDILSMYSVHRPGSKA